MHLTPFPYEARESSKIADLNRVPLEPDRLHFSGLIAAQFGHDDVAIAYFRRALALDSSRSEYYLDLSRVLGHANRHAEATTELLRAFRITGDKPDIYASLGRALCAQDRLIAATACFREALRLSPRDAQMRCELGDILFGQHRYVEALEHFNEAVRLEPNSSRALFGIGRSMLQRGEYHAAFSSLRDALKGAPHNVEIHVCAGQALVMLGSLQAALDVFRAALSLAPTDVTAARSYLHAVQLRGQADEVTHAWLQLAEAFRSHSQYLVAASAFRQVLRRQRDSTPARLGLARSYVVSGKPRLAIRHLTAILAQSPEDRTAHNALAGALFATANVDRAWEEFRWRYSVDDLRRRGGPYPVWDGTPLHGRTILLWTTAGRGDVVQFLRYVRFAKAAGGRVVVQCHHPGLIPLVERMPEVDVVIPFPATLPTVDVHAPLVLFPAFIRASRLHASVEGPYLSVHARLEENWRRAIGKRSGKLVALCWGGSVDRKGGRARSMSLETMAPLGGVSGVHFISLQHGPQAAELLAQPKGLHIRSVMPESSSIADASALICNVDLVVTVDTLAAHLAGSLGKPVWTLLRYAADWRWGIAGERTAWYQTMRLFRQTRAGDWSGVIEKVRDALAAM